MALDLTRSAAFSTSFIEWLRGKGPILIVTHDHPDPDALAAAYALRHLILMKIGQMATIAFEGVVGRSENRVMVRELEIETVSLGALDPREFAVICMVDAQPGAGNTSLPPNCPVDLVIDHHPLREITGACRWVDVRSDYGAAATILFEYLMAHNLSIATKLATILFYAIESETQGLGREWSSADREAYRSLLPLCNSRILYRITHPSLPCGYFAKVNTALESARIYDVVLVFNLGSVDHPEIVAEMADFLLRAEGVEVVLGIGEFAGEGILSLRSSDHSANIGDLIQKITAGYGSSGGHGLIAGGQIQPLPRDAADRANLEAELVRRLLVALGRESVPPRPLLTD
ncbi:MAG: DHH family phosphoesterase [Desulfuromonadales bacterium]|nr:DHH family phosphoesterase [Desulfuromonadales bacterium]